MPLYRAGLGMTPARGGLRPFFMLTNKPVLAVVNIGEEQIAEAEQLAAPVRAELGEAEVVALCVQLEAEAAQLDESERPELLAALGLGSGALDRFLASAYHLLGLRTFLTTEPKESAGLDLPGRCVRRSNAPERSTRTCSEASSGPTPSDGTICSRPDRGSAAREQGRVRSEGKDYLVADGDVMEFRFNV